MPSLSAPRSLTVRDLKGGAALLSRLVAPGEAMANPCA